MPLLPLIRSSLLKAAYHKENLHRGEGGVTETVAAAIHACNAMLTQNALVFASLLLPCNLDPQKLA